MKELIMIISILLFFLGGFVLTNLWLGGIIAFVSLLVIIYLIVSEEK